MTAVEQIASDVPTGRRDAPGVPDRPNPLETALSANEGEANLSGTPDDRRADWLTWRGQGIGASEVAGILGLSPWMSPWSVWAEKVGLNDGPDETEAMEFGLMAEPMLKGYFERRTGLWVLGEQTWCQHPDEPWMRATVDGFVHESHCGTDDNELAIGNVEFKTSSEPPWDEVPVHYQCQASWQMAVTGMPKCWFGVLHIAFGRPTFRVYEFDRDDADIAVLVGRCRTFWFDHVVAGVPPIADGHRATTDALARAWDADDQLTLEATVPLVATVERLAHLKVLSKDVAGEITGAENTIKAALGEATALTAGFDSKGRPRPLVIWRAQDRTTIDSKALRAEMPDVAEKYSRMSTSRVLLLKPAAAGTPTD